MLVPPERWSAVLVMISSKSESISNRLTLDELTGKITISQGVLLMASFERNFFTQRYELRPQETKDSTLSYSEIPVSLSHLGLNRYGFVTDMQTGGQT